MHHSPLSRCMAAFAMFALGGVADAGPFEFRLTYTPAVVAGPFTGRVYVMMTQGRAAREPRRGPDWFNPGPMFAIDVRGVAPGQTMTLGSEAIGFPDTLDMLRPGVYTAQAVLDLDRGERDFSNAPGNGYSDPTTVELSPAAGGVVELTINHVVSDRPYPVSDRVRLVDLPSKLVSAFAGREVHLKAGVALPTSYPAQPQKRYPVVYEIPGFGGTHFFRGSTRQRTNIGGVEFIYVMLNPECRTGHHVFADSANNGPYGRALIEELIPHIESRFRAIGRAEARFVTGHSSGGWSSLWLQTAYPDSFGGVWSTAPDPVDFRDFQRINLYRPGVNMFTDEQGASRPIARVGDQPRLYYKPFSDMEVVMGHGGQLGSFEAVFSPRMADGRPRLLWNRRTGAVDAETAKAWRKYDIALKMEREWPILGPKLAGKIHVYTGTLDTFYLDGAVELLKQALQQLGSDAKVELFPGKNHGDLMDGNLVQRIGQEMAAAFRRSFPNE